MPVDTTATISLKIFGLGSCTTKLHVRWISGVVRNLTQALWHPPANAPFSLPTLLSSPSFFVLWPYLARLLFPCTDQRRAKHLQLRFTSRLKFQKPNSKCPKYLSSSLLDSERPGMGFFQTALARSARSTNRRSADEKRRKRSCRS